MAVVSKKRRCERILTSPAAEEGFSPSTLECGSLDDDTPRLVLVDACDQLG